MRAWERPSGETGIATPSAEDTAPRSNRHDGDPETTSPSAPPRSPDRNVAIPVESGYNPHPYLRPVAQLARVPGPLRTILVRTQSPDRDSCDSGAQVPRVAGN